MTAEMPPKGWRRRDSHDIEVLKRATQQALDWARAWDEHRAPVPAVSIIVSSFNRLDLLRPCLASLRDTVPADAPVEWICLPGDNLTSPREVVQLSPAGSVCLNKFKTLSALPLSGLNALRVENPTGFSLSPLHLAATIFAPLQKPDSSKCPKISLIVLRSYSRML